MFLRLSVHCSWRFSLCAVLQSLSSRADTFCTSLGTKTPSRSCSTVHQRICIIESARAIAYITWSASVRALMSMLCVCSGSRTYLKHNEQYVQESGVSPLMRSQATIMQLNIGLYCNQACSHCHVESSPKRKEMMDRPTAERCIELLKASPSINTLDITGGAPELNSEFRFLVQAASQLDVEIIDRCNLTVLVEPGQEDLPQFLADNKVQTYPASKNRPLQYFSQHPCPKFGHSKGLKD